MVSGLSSKARLPSLALASEMGLFVDGMAVDDAVLATDGAGVFAPPGKRFLEGGLGLEVAGGGGWWRRGELENRGVHERERPANCDAKKIGLWRALSLGRLSAPLTFHVHIALLPPLPPLSEIFTLAISRSITLSEIYTLPSCSTIVGSGTLWTDLQDEARAIDIKKHISVSVTLCLCVSVSPFLCLSACFLLSLSLCVFLSVFVSVSLYS